MPASRVESESKPEPKRWESDDYKADLTAHPEEIKDLCPIVITTIAAAPTQNKDADGNVIYTVTGAAGINWATGHLYQTTDPALEYYLTNMKEHCDPDSDKC